MEKSSYRQEEIMEYRRNEETGIIEVWYKGKKIGEVITLGDILAAEDADNA